MQGDTSGKLTTGLLGIGRESFSTPVSPEIVKGSLKIRFFYADTKLRFLLLNQAVLNR